jgi:magnesium chelatase family protein
VPRLDKSALDPDKPKGETSAIVRTRIIRAYQKQLRRNDKSNGELTAKEIERYCTIKKQDKQLLEQAMDKFKLSARAYHRILKLARTIADISESEQIEAHHLTEAITYRCLDRFNNH